MYRFVPSHFLFSIDRPLLFFISLVIERATAKIAFSCLTDTQMILVVVVALYKQAHYQHHTTRGMLSLFYKHRNLLTKAQRARPRYSA
jgi:hypothetical protein